MYPVSSIQSNSGNGRLAADRDDAMHDPVGRGFYRPERQAISTNRRARTHPQLRRQAPPRKGNREPRRPFPCLPAQHRLPPFLAFHRRPSRTHPTAQRHHQFVRELSVPSALAAHASLVPGAARTPRGHGTAPPPARRLCDRHCGAPATPAGEVRA